MADQRFFKKAGPFTLGHLAALTGAQLSDGDAATVTIEDVSTLEEGDAHKVTFLDNKKYLEQFKSTKARACFVRPEMAQFAPAGMALLTHKNPYKAYALAAQAFYPNEHAVGHVAASAHVDATAKLGHGCHIGHHAVIEAHAEIGDNVRIDANAVIGQGVRIGDNSHINANCVISHAMIGKNVQVYPGAVIGRAGFGFAIDPTGFVSVPQLGRVIIEDGVEIGANTTIDRGAGPDTVIGMGTRIDNLVQIGHNVQIGKFCVIVSQTGISGSTKLGDFVMTGGQTGLAGHLKIGAGAKIAAQSGVMRDIDAGGEVMGSPAMPIKQYMRQVAMMSRMSDRKKEE